MIRSRVHCIIATIINFVINRPQLDPISQTIYPLLLRLHSTPTTLPFPFPHLFLSTPFALANKTEINRSLRQHEARHCEVLGDTLGNTTFCCAPA